MVRAKSQHIGQSNRDRRTNLRNGRKVYKIQENSIVQPGTNLNLNHRLPTPQTFGWLKRSVGGLDFDVGYYEANTLPPYHHTPLPTLPTI